MKTDYKAYLAMSVLAAVIVGGIIFGMKTCSETPVKEANRGYDLCRRIAKDVVNVLQFRPIITINQEVVFEKTAPIAELALAEKRFSHTYTWEQSWAGSTKKLSLQGAFKAKGGYNINKSFVIAVATDGKSVRATVPEVEILSVELLSEKILVDENGLWNNISKEDRENAKNSLLKEARAKAQQSSLKSDVESEFERRLRGLVEPDVSLAVLVNPTERR